MTEPAVRTAGAAAFSLTIRHTHVAVVLGGITAFLVLTHLTLQAIAILSGHDHLFGLVQMFNLDAEHNLPTLFGGLLFLVSAMLCAILWSAGRAEGRAERAWLMLAYVFGFLGVDEFSVWHERLDALLRSALDPSGVLTFAWVIPYGFLTIVLALAMIPHLRRLEPTTRNYLILAGAIYVAGAIGFEMLGGYVYEGESTTHTWRWVTLTTIEELLEMVGMSLFVYTLLRQIRRRYGGVAVTLDGDSDEPA